MGIPILLFIVGLVCLIKGGDWFVDGAVGIARRFHLPELLIGATVVSIGTTLPEVLVSVTSAVHGHGDIAYGNAIGSVICNTSLIAALTVAIRPTKTERRSMLFPVGCFFAAAVFYCLTAYLSGSFDRVTGFILLGVFIAYMTVNVVVALRTPVPTPSLDENGAAPMLKDEKSEKASPLWKDILFLVLGSALIAVGANLLVDNGTIIAERLGIPEVVISLVFVSLGTSLPELITAISSLIKGHGSLSLGNIIGANLFNLVLVSGMSVAIAPFDVPSGKLLFGQNASLVLDIPVMLAVMLILTVPTLIRKKLSRWQGILLLGIYAAYTTLLFVL